MPTRKIEIYCTKCQRTSETDYEVATAYMSLTRWMCDCGEMYHISDYVNGPTYASHVSKEEDDRYTKYMEEHTRKESIMDKEQGRKMYQAVDKWLNALSTEAISKIEAQRTFTQTIDKEFVIETILLHCRTEDDLLEKLYRESLGTVDFHASGPQCFTDKRDWYIISIHDLYNGEVSRSYSSQDDADTVVKKLMMDKDNYDVAYTVISVPLGTKVSI